MRSISISTVSASLESAPVEHFHFDCAGGPTPNLPNLDGHGSGRPYRIDRRPAPPGLIRASSFLLVTTGEPSFGFIMRSSQSIYSCGHRSGLMALGDAWPRRTRIPHIQNSFRTATGPVLLQPHIYLLVDLILGSAGISSRRVSLMLRTVRAARLRPFNGRRTNPETPYLLPTQHSWAYINHQVPGRGRELQIIISNLIPGRCAGHATSLGKTPSVIDT